MPLLALAATLALGLASCATPDRADGPAQPADALTVYATTGYLADAVANIAPDADVTTMVGPGGDPHTYQPSTRDIQTILAADVVLWTGLHLEAQMTELLEGQGDRQLAVGEEVPAELLIDWPETDADGSPRHDPHIWNSPEAWTVVVGAIAAKLGDVDPDNAEAYRRNADAYALEIERTAADAGALMATIPADRRILVTGHDAFAYFGETYGLEVHATDFVSTEASLSPRDISALARLVVDNRVPVIFQDNQANPQAIASLREAVRALGWEVEVSDAELYADSLGAVPPLDTHLGVFSHNARAVAEALGRDR